MVFFSMGMRFCLAGAEERAQKGDGWSVQAIYSDFQSESKSSLPLLSGVPWAVTDVPEGGLASSRVRYSNWLKLPVLACLRLSRARVSWPLWLIITLWLSWKGRRGVMSVAGREIAAISGNSKARR